MDDLEIINTIKRLNPWYRNKEALISKPFRRSDFDELYESLEKVNLGIVLIGARRVGKSVLLTQLIEKLIFEGVPPKNILFLKGDNTILSEYDKTNGFTINKCLSLYEEYILDSDMRDIKEEKLYLFVDEIQALSKWEGQVKDILDDVSLPVKVFVTGSSADSLMKGVQAPLVGRVLVSNITVFSYSEYVSYLFRENKEYESFISVTGDAKKKFQDGMVNSKISLILEAIKIYNNKIKPKIPKESYNDFLTIGGYPEVIVNCELERDDYLMNSILMMTFSHDVLKTTEIRSTPDELKRLMLYIAKSMTQIVDEGKIVRKKIVNDVRTVKKYIDYLHRARLLSISEKFSLTPKISTGANRKVYISDSGLINTLLFKNKKDIVEDREFRGKLVEAVAHNHLISFMEKSTGEAHEYIPYYMGEKEIDFMIRIRNKILPFEIKIQAEIEEREIQHIQKYVEDNRATDFAIIGTDIIEEQRENMYLIPLETLLFLM